MALKIKKQYRQPDGTLIEIEGTEAEIESFEKKQRKQKQQIESEEKKKTILYGKDLEEIRKIVQEEITKIPRIEYHYHGSAVSHWFPAWSGGSHAIGSSDAVIPTITTGASITVSNDSIPTNRWLSMGSV